MNSLHSQLEVLETELAEYRANLSEQEAMLEWLMDNDLDSYGGESQRDLEGRICDIEEEIKGVEREIEEVEFAIKKEQWEDDYNDRRQDLRRYS